MNYIWFLLIAVGVIVAAITGSMANLTDAMLDSVKVAVELSIGLIGVMAFWLGLMRIAEEAGLVRMLSRLLRPLLTRLFPDIPPEHPAMGSMLANIAANMLGLGNSATALGLRAMKDLQQLNVDKQSASNAMATFLAINTSSVTIIPATVIAVRVSAGSTAPTEIIGPAILATGVSTIVGISAAKLLQRFSKPQVRSVEVTGTEEDNG
ncbi:nucleoside recognition protein [bacterium]|nr:nucleoside recognition protein [bacterium]